MSVDLENLITQAYENHLNLVRKQEERQRKLEEEKTQKAIAHLKGLLDKVVQPDLQEALGIEFETYPNTEPVAKFNYKNFVFYIKYGPFTDGEWKFLFGGDFRTARSECLVNELLVEMGRIRADDSTPSSNMSLEQAFGALCDCLSEAEDVFAHRNDFLHESESFGENLKTAVCLLQKMVDELAVCLGD